MLKETNVFIGVCPINIPYVVVSQGDTHKILCFCYLEGVTEIPAGLAKATPPRTRTHECLPVRSTGKTVYAGRGRMERY